MRTALDRIDLTVLYQPFAAKLRPLVDACDARGVVVVATSGLRSYAEQARIYAIGRTTDHDGKPITDDDPAFGRHATKAPPGRGPHQFGIAVDFTRDLDSNLASGLQPDLDDEHYRELGEEAEKLGLVSGFYWGWQDAHHVELPIKRRGLRWIDLDRAYRKAGYTGVFQLLETRGPW